jgi:hypothetical protein
MTPLRTVLLKQQIWAENPAVRLATSSPSPTFADEDTRRMPLRALGLGEIRRDLPDMAAGIGEAGSAHSPCPVHRAVEQRHFAPIQLRAYCIHIIHMDGGRR